LKELKSLIFQCVSFFIFLLMLFTNSCSDKELENNQKLKNTTIEQNGHSVSVFFAGTKTVSYVYDEIQFKPYIKELYSPNGLNVLLDGPDDHKHHHGLMYAIKVDGTNFWEEGKSGGRQEPQNTSLVVSDSDEKNSEKSFVSQINWVRPKDQEILLRENRTIKVGSPNNINARILTWTSELSLPEGKVSAELGGNHYHGLGLRFIRSMDENGDFFTVGNKKGEIFRGEERLIPDTWCAYTATAGEGKDVTVAMFKSLQNPGENTIWFTMKTPFAYLSATKAWHEKPHILNVGETLSLTYGVAVWDGRVGADKIDKVYRIWMNDK
jgi:hypothetical protein